MWQIHVSCTRVNNNSSRLFFSAYAYMIFIYFGRCKHLASGFCDTSWILAFFFIKLCIFDTGIMLDRCANVYMSVKCCYNLKYYFVTSCEYKFWWQSQGFWLPLYLESDWKIIWLNFYEIHHSWCSNVFKQIYNRKIETWNAPMTKLFSFNFSFRKLLLPSIFQTM